MCNIPDNVIRILKGKLDDTDYNIDDKGRVFLNGERVKCLYCEKPLTEENAGAVIVDNENNKLAGLLCDSITCQQDFLDDNK